MAKRFGDARITTDSAALIWSGRRESNPRNLLGRQEHEPFCHARMLVLAGGIEPPTLGM